MPTVHPRIRGNASASKRTPAVAWSLAILLSVGGMGAMSPSARAQAEPATADAAVPDVVSRSEQMIEAGDYDGAIGLLEAEGDVASPEVAYALAYARFLRGTVGHHTEGADPADIEAAARLANVAVAAGNARGYNLLYMIHGLEGVPEHDPARAAAFLRQGAEAGETGAMLNYTNALFYGTPTVPRDRVAVCPFVDTLLDDEQARGLVAHVAGLIRLTGDCGKPADPEAGVALIRIAATRGIALAQRDLAVALSRGIGVAKDEAAALEWFERAGENGDGEALWQLGMAHVEGRLRPRDGSRAVDYFRRAVAHGHAGAMVSLGVMHASGDGVPQDYGKTLELYSRAAALGHPHAHRGLALMHALGQGVAVDRVRARVFYMQALELGQQADPAVRDFIESGMSRKEKAESDRLFAEWRARR